jgi:predicted secreted protein
MTIDETANGRRIELPVGEALDVVLTGQATAGYRWKVISPGDPACVLVEDRFEAAPRPPGAPGTHHFTFRAERAGNASIRLSYGRRWEDAAARTFQVEVAVR